MNTLPPVTDLHIAPLSSDILMNEIETLWGLQIGILDEIDEQIEAAEDMGAETHMLETRTEELRDEIVTTFSRLRSAGNNDAAWERAFLRAGALYEELVSFRTLVSSEVMLIAGAAELQEATPPLAFLH
ncbi:MULTISPECIES: hypothetical protein [Microvirga]|uniref:hypothetical protein n=1 Tax=Microvirga TaxID=186650 RepID=UPI0021CA1786|nr:MULTISPECIES: hypothetical protein [unclassified Microvirga]